MYLSTGDAARTLGVTSATVRLMVKRGDLPCAAMTESGVYLFARPDVERLAAERAQRHDGGRR